MIHEITPKREIWRHRPFNVAFDENGKRVLPPRGLSVTTGRTTATFHTERKKTKREESMS
jgi:hypothetical protein